MPDVQRPLLTITIPTYNRAGELGELLKILLPQLVELAAEGRGGEVEVIVSDNASPDQTPEVCAEAKRVADAAGVLLEVVRQERNLGPDRNFVSSFRRARGKYFWVLGDDDIVVPGGIRSITDELRAAEYNLVFLVPGSFRNDWRSELRQDPYGRRREVVHTALEFAKIVNIYVTFISGMIVNLDRLNAIHAEPPEVYYDSYLIQLSWVLPLLREDRTNLVLWQSWVVGREANSGGYSLSRVFGENLQQMSRRLLPTRPDIARLLSNYALRAWFPPTLLELRRERGEKFALQESAAMLRRTFPWNYRFWLFCLPVIQLPLPLAAAWAKVVGVWSKSADWLQRPADSVKRIRSKVTGKPIDA